MTSEDTLTLIAVGVGIVALMFSLIAVVNVPTIYDLNNGLVLWLPLNDGFGNASDYSGLLNHGIISGALWVDGKYGKALSFDGTNYVSCGNATCFDITESVTLVAWICPNDVSGYHYIVGKGYFYPYAMYIRGYGGGGLAFRGQWIDGSYFDMDSSVPILTGVWQLAVVVRDYITGEIRIYVNAVLKKTYTGYTQLMKTSTVNITLGRPNMSENYFNGIIDDVHIYNRALTNNEISLLYNNTQCVVVS